MISTAGKLARSLNSPLGLALSLIPLFVLALFAHPQADDYIYAAQAEKLGFVGRSSTGTSNGAGGTLRPCSRRGSRWRFR